MPRYLKYRGKFIFSENKSLKKRVNRLVSSLSLNWVDAMRIFTVSSINSRSRAVARIWGLSKIWQEILNIKPAYIIETVSEKFEKLSEGQKDEVILHELAHIPKNFSGALVAHTRRGKSSFHKKLDELITNHRRQKRK